MKVLIFLRQTERRQANWKIDTISVVQELNEYEVHGFVPWTA